VLRNSLVGANSLSLRLAYSFLVFSFCLPCSKQISAAGFLEMKIPVESLSSNENRGTIRKGKSITNQQIRTRLSLGMTHAQAFNYPTPRRWKVFTAPLDTQAAVSILASRDIGGLIAAEQNLAELFVLFMAKEQRCEFFQGYPR
jgi:hypothetical protein